MLEELAWPLRERGLSVELELDRAEPLHAALVDRVQRTCADLVDPAGIRAETKDGVLRIHIPKKEPLKAKSIHIEVK